jgi:hypothetical protein
MLDKYTGEEEFTNDPDVHRETAKKRIIKTTGFPDEELLLNPRNLTIGSPDRGAWVTGDPLTDEGSL